MAKRQANINPSDTTESSIGSADSDKKQPAKPISLYPMSEEEALKRLLRVPPPEKASKEDPSR